jgi:RHS repeat-associated protein
LAGYPLGVKNYVSGIEYKGAALEAIYTSEGRCTPNAAKFFYEYSIKDHLGNARVSFKTNETVNVAGQVTATTLDKIQENHYYPFGMEMEGAWLPQVGAENAYQYNGKELNEDFGLNLIDYGARWYDAAIGRWWSVDPLAEKFLSKTSYNYGLNNPIRMIDPNGMEATTNSPEFAMIINNAWNATKHGTDMHFEVKGNFDEKKEEKKDDNVIVGTTGGTEARNPGHVEVAVELYDKQDDGSLLKNGKVKVYNLAPGEEVGKGVLTGNNYDPAYETETMTRDEYLTSRNLSKEGIFELATTPAEDRKTVTSLDARVNSKIEYNLENNSCASFALFGLPEKYSKIGIEHVKYSLMNYTLKTPNQVAKDLMKTPSGVSVIKKVENINQLPTAQKLIDKE